MDDILKRLVGAYLGFTASLWAVSLAMSMNGSAYEKNSAWAIVRNLRFYFTAPLVLAVAVAALASLFWSLLEAREGQEMAREAKERAERERLESLARKRLEAEREARRREELEEAKYAREEKAQAEAKRREAEEKQKATEKQMRSARTAAERALDDF